MYIVFEFVCSVSVRFIPGIFGISGSVCRIEFLETKGDGRLITHKASFITHMNVISTYINTLMCVCVCVCPSVRFFFSAIWNLIGISFGTKLLSDLEKVLTQKYI